MTTLLAPLVGSFNKPPAQTVLKHLPSGAGLILVPEPENPYDPAAIKVMVEPSTLPESQWSQLEVELPLQGATLEQLMSSGPVFLGYIAASGGKPLSKAREANPGQQLVGNREVAEFDGAAMQAVSVKLRFGLDGKPLVAISTEPQS